VRKLMLDLQLWLECKLAFRKRRKEAKWGKRNANKLQSITKL
jgi:hypothetical protein